MKANEVMSFAFNQDRKFCEGYRSKDQDEKDKYATASYPRVLLPGQVLKSRRKHSESDASQTARKDVILEHLQRSIASNFAQKSAEIEIDVDEIGQYERIIMQRQKAPKTNPKSPRRIGKMGSSASLVHSQLPRLLSKNSGSSDCLTMEWNVIEDE